MATIAPTSANLTDLLRRVAGQGDAHQQAACCTCPACTVLQCLERPRFFAGQLLTDAELTAEQDYVRAKLRLHNKFLQGCGVVCGLQVSCHACEGWVNVHQGYAIDCCGNDIVVCQDTSFDVISEIKKCHDRERQQRTVDCRPLRSPTDEQCQDIDQVWCLTIRYEEKETRPTTTLRNGTSATCSCGSSCSCGGSGQSGCGCGCGGGGNGKSGCGCGTQHRSTATTTATRPAGSIKSGTGLALAACEPTRIVEGYRLEVCKAPAGFCGDANTALDGTLLQRIATCLRTLSDFLGKRIPVNTRTLLTRAYFSPAEVVAGIGQQDPAVLYDSCCRFRQAVYDLYVQNPLNVRCQALDVFDQITCPRPQAGDNFDRQRYFQQIHASIQSVGTLLFQYVLDCICGAFLPSCSTDPCDDRLILACMTIRNDKIVKICNWSCRRYAGSFPALSYWLSLVPIVPFLRTLIERLCCTDWIRGGDLGQTDRLTALLNSVDATGHLRANFAAGDFALPRHYVSLFDELLNKVSLTGLANLIQPRSVNLPALVGSPLADVRHTFAEAGVAVHEVQVASAADVPLTTQLGAAPLAAPGEAVTVYTSKGQIVGYGRYEPHVEMAALRGELEALRAQVAQMRPPPR